MFIEVKLSKKLRTQAAIQKLVSELKQLASARTFYTNVDQLVQSIFPESVPPMFCAAMHCST